MGEQAIVRECRDLGEVGRIWGRLSRERPPHYLWETFAGFEAWARAEPGGPPPLLVACRRGEPVALLPVLRVTRSVRGVRLRFLSPASDDHWGTGAPILGSDANASMAALLEGLRADGGWDVLELGPLLRDGETLRLLMDHGRWLGFAPRIFEVKTDPVVVIARGWSDYYASLSTNLRSQVKRGEAKLERAGEVTFQEVLGGEDLDAQLEELYRVEQSGWKGRDGTAIASRESTRRFYTRLAHEAARRGELRLHMLRVAGHCVAADYCIASGKSVYMLKVGYDEGWSKCSPGQVMRKRVLEHLFALGRDEVYDMMAGGGERREYKLRWANSLRPVVMVRLFAPRSVRGRLAALAEKLVTRAWRTPPLSPPDERVQAQSSPDRAPPPPSSVSPS